MPDVFKALAHPVRREILAALRVGSLTAGEIAERFDLAKPTLSGHFAVLREAGLVTAEKKGTTVIYRINLSVAEEAMAELMTLFGVGGGAETREDDR